MGQNRDDVWTETGILDEFPTYDPKVVWRTPIHGGFAGPAVAGGVGFIPSVWAYPSNNES